MDKSEHVRSNAAKALEAIDSFRTRSPEPLISDESAEEYKANDTHKTFATQVSESTASHKTNMVSVNSDQELLEIEDIVSNNQDILSAIKSTYGYESDQFFKQN